MFPPDGGSFPKVVLCRLRTALLRCFAGNSSRYWRVSEITMSSRRLFGWLRVLAPALSCCSAVSIMLAQGSKQTVPQNPIPETDADHIKERNEWFFRGRLVHGKSSAELRHRAYQAKLQMRARQAAKLARGNGQAASSSVPWTPLGPMPLASDASGNGTQDYHQVSGRSTAIAIDPADPTGNTVYIGGAQSGVWKSTNAANNDASSVNLESAHRRSSHTVDRCDRHPARQHRPHKDRNSRRHWRSGQLRRLVFRTRHPALG